MYTLKLFSKPKIFNTFSHGLLVSIATSIATCSFREYKMSSAISAIDLFKITIASVNTFEAQRYTVT